MANIKTITNRCEMVMFGAMCGMVWFLPISAALVEWMFGISFLAFLIKRIFLCRYQLSENYPKVEFSSKIKIVINEFKPIENCLNRPIFIYFCVVLISSIFGMNPGASLSAMASKLLQSVFTAFIFIEAVQSKKRVKIITGVMLASLTLMVSNGFFQYITQQGFIRQRIVYDGRILSSFRHPNDFASYLLVMVPFLASLSVIQFFNLKIKRDAFLDQSDSSGFFSSKAFVGMSFLLFTAAGLCLGLTYSRGGWLACGISMIFLVIKKPKLLIIYLMTGALFLGVFVTKMVNERSTNIGGSYKNVFLNLSDRGRNWTEASRLVLEKPILGIGLNNYTQMAKEREFHRAEYPHNCYLQMAVETGLTGLLGFLWILIVLFKNSLRYLAQLKERLSYHLLLGLNVGLTGFLIQSFFDTNFYSTQLGSFMWLSIGFIMAIPKVELNSQN